MFKKKIKENSFAILSDFHSITWPIDKIINEYLYKYDKIYILGDATDRGLTNTGKGGVNLLIKIMNICKLYPSRVYYIPGNHDDMLYKYMISINKERNCIGNIIINGGSDTICDINILYNKNRRTFEELKEWIGTRPIQYKHEYNGNKYCLAHAFFDNDLYNYNPNFNLNDYTKLKNITQIDRVFNVLWFRKRDGYYYKEALPNYDEITIIGHTTKQSRGEESLNLEGIDGIEREIICVDGGIAITPDKTLMYDGTLHTITIEKDKETIKEKIRRRLK